MKTKLDTFLLESERSVEIEPEQAVDILVEKCKKSYVKFGFNWWLFRGKRNAGQIELVDPTKAKKPRVSANTANYYTLIMDNSERWADYPKRSQSILCSTNASDASNYGKVFQVYPFDDARLGVAPGSDIWGGFQEAGLEDVVSAIQFALVIADSGRLNDLEYTRQQAEANYFDKIADSEKRYTTSKALQDGLSEFDLMAKSFGGMRATLSGISSTGHVESDILAQAHKLGSGDTYKGLEKLLDPNDNGFKVINVEEVSKIIGRANEVWTDSTCVLIRTAGGVRQLINELTEDRHGISIPLTRRHGSESDE